jgi:hypothetical protein
VRASRQVPPVPAPLTAPGSTNSLLAQGPSRLSLSAFCFGLFSLIPYLRCAKQSTCYHGKALFSLATIIVRHSYILTFALKPNIDSFIDIQLPIVYNVLCYAELRIKHTKERQEDSAEHHLVLWPMTLAQT